MPTRWIAIDRGFLSSVEIPKIETNASGKAGAILQKLENYRIRLAVVCPPGSVVFSSRFGEMLADERRGTHFGVFEDRQAASDWLGRP